MDKNDLTESIIGWMDSFLKEKFGTKYNTIKVFAPNRSLKLHPEPLLRNIQGSNSWEFTPDIIALMSNSEKTDIVLVNRSLSSISLKELGEMKCYAQLSNPILAMVVSPKAASGEVNAILLENEVRDRILVYDGKYPISIVGWDAKTNKPLEDSVSPLEMENFFFTS